MTKILLAVTQLILNLVVTFAASFPSTRSRCLMIANLPSYPLISSIYTTTKLGLGLTCPCSQWCPSVSRCLLIRPHCQTLSPPLQRRLGRVKWGRVTEAVLSRPITWWMAWVRCFKVSFRFRSTLLVTWWVTLLQCFEDWFRHWSTLLVTWWVTLRQCFEDSFRFWNPLLVVWCGMSANFWRTI